MPWHALPSRTVRLSRSRKQVEQIKLAIGAASSLEEMQKLERAIKAGNFEVIAKAAAAAGGS